MFFLIEWLNILVGAVTGVLSSWGLGGGTLLLLYLLHWEELPQRVAQGINLLYYLPMALLALPNHKKSGYLSKELCVPAIAGGLLCAALGCWLGTALETQLLRKIFGGFLLAVGVATLIQKDKI